ncbi:MAG: UDP-N-acetylmuramoyl-L-alanyl-D-glutamate--2,6-diaminopimelate ligase [Alphaproteobacteria bacterium]|nr:UDP-N-acetylmuramoyl-L-alanyl-D-glutamate--2,6-diaminopimelate ligase [Alphaproteobacteria bacterium]
MSHKLSDLISNHELASPRLGLHETDPMISSLASDSRRVTAGGLFIALDGAKQNGADFIPDAIQNEAAAIVTAAHSSEPWMRTPEPRQLLAAVAARFYPIKPKTIVAVTGTNGKTSVANFCQQIWEGLGLKAASIGTLGIKKTSRELPNPSLTTPDTITLHRILQELAHEGFTHVAIEASSHGLEQYRLDHIALTAGGYTNLTQDHLDYHQTMEKYFSAKSRLFRAILSAEAIAVLNGNDPQIERLKTICLERGIKVISYGNREEIGKNDLFIASHSYTANGQKARVRFKNQEYLLRIQFIAEFQLYNLLCAIGLVMSEGYSFEMIVDLVNSKELHNIPGRIEKVITDDPSKNIYIDYAHTPDGLKSILESMKQYLDNSGRKGSIIVVFGCGGDRDRTKRPIMGAIAAELANCAIITDDNPRSETPAAIRQEIIDGIRSQTGSISDSFKYQEIGDRSIAIKTALEMASQNDIVLVAGKGHENGQIIGDKVLEFSDEVEVRKWLKTK